MTGNNTRRDGKNELNQYTCRVSLGITWASICFFLDVAFIWWGRVLLLFVMNVLSLSESDHLKMWRQILKIINQYNWENVPWIKLDPSKVLLKHKDIFIKLLEKLGSSQWLTFCRPSRIVCRFFFRVSSLDSYFILRSGTTAIRLKRMSWYGSLGKRAAALELSLEGECRS